MLDPLISAVNDRYVVQLLHCHNIDAYQVGNVFKAHGFEDHNYLVDINRVFSNYPTYSIIDRTCSVPQPLQYHVPRPWCMPTQQLTLDQAFENRVTEFEKTGQKINVFWSGGIDSTTAVTAFLKHLKNPNQLRIIYSPWSTYEHPEYLKFLSQWPGVETVDMSGEVYMQQQLDGVLITGDTGDEMHASLDKSFINTHGYNVLFSSWKDLFYQTVPNSEFINFCEQYFARSGRDITTVIEARWWFYMICKLRGTLNETKLPFFVSGHTKFDPGQLHGFFDFAGYESYIYFNLDQIMPTEHYPSWRQMLKDYCFKFDGLVEWHTVHKKITSRQMIDYSSKKVVLNDRRWLLILQDGTRIATSNLPLFSGRELKQHYGNDIDYLFGNST